MICKENIRRKFFLKNQSSFVCSQLKAFKYSYLTHNIPKLIDIFCTKIHIFLVFLSNKNNFLYL